MTAPAKAKSVARNETIVDCGYGKSVASAICVVVEPRRIKTIRIRLWTKCFCEQQAELGPRDCSEEQTSAMGSAHGRAPAFLRGDGVFVDCDLPSARIPEFRAWDKGG